MAVLERMYNTNYKGFDFLFLSETTESGKKTVAHEYPNSNRRFTEELGEIPPKFSMSTVVYGTIDKRIEFENVLRSKGTGQLSHPFYGVIDNVMATTYTVNSTQKEVGVFNFSINFEVSSTDFVHVITTIDEQTVSKNAVDVREEIYDDFSGSYEVPETVSGFDAVVESVTEAFDTIKSNIKDIINPIQEKAAEFNSVVNDAISNVNTIVQNAETLKNTFSSVYTSVLNIVDIPNKLENYWNSLLSYKSVLGIPLSNALKRDTSRRIEISNNVSLIEEQVRLVALISTYEVIAYKELKTSNEINESKEFLNEQYEINLNDNIDNDGLLLIDNLDTRNAFATLKNNTTEILNDKLVNSWKISTLNSNLSSFSILSYKYYNSIDNIDTIINMNENLNSSGFRRDVDILISE